IRAAVPRVCAAGEQRRTRTSCRSEASISRRGAPRPSRPRPHRPPPATPHYWKQLLPPRSSRGSRGLRHRGPRRARPAARRVAGRERAKERALFAWRGVPLSRLVRRSATTVGHDPPAVKTGPGGDTGLSAARANPIFSLGRPMRRPTNEVEVSMPPSTSEDTPFYQTKTPAEWVEVLGSARAPQRRQAALALGMLGREAKAAVPALVVALGDKNELVRRQAAQSLGDFGARARAAVGKLGEALRDAKDFVREQAADALGKIGPAARAAVPALVEALRDPVKYVRRQAAVALGKAGPPAHKALEALLQALEDPEEDVQSAAARALGEIHPEIVTVLRDALRSPDARVRAGAARALGEIGPAARDAVPALRRA